MSKLVGRAEAAAQLGVVPGRINRWVADGAPVGLKGRSGCPAQYDVAALRRWLKAREQTTKATGVTLEQERAQLARAHRLKLEREGRIRDGELFPRGQIILAGQAVVKQWAAAVRGLPRRMSQAGFIKTAQERAVLGLCDDLLREIAAWRPLPETSDERETES